VGVEFYDNENMFDTEREYYGNLHYNELSDGGKEEYHKRKMEKT